MLIVPTRHSACFAKAQRLRGFGGGSVVGAAGKQVSRAKRQPAGLGLCGSMGQHLRSFGSCRWPRISNPSIERMSCRLRRQATAHVKR